MYNTTQTQIFEWCKIFALRDPWSYYEFDIPHYLKIIEGNSLWIHQCRQNVAGSRIFLSWCHISIVHSTINQPTVVLWYVERPTFRDQPSYLERLTHQGRSRGNDAYDHHLEISSWRKTNYWRLLYIASCVWRAGAAASCRRSVFYPPTCSVRRWRSTDSLTQDVATLRLSNAANQCTYPANAKDVLKGSRYGYVDEHWLRHPHMG